MEEHFKKKQKISEEQLKEKKILEKEEEILEKEFYANFLEFLKERAKNTLKLDPLESLISEESIDLSKFILSINSLDFNKKTRFWNSFNSNLQSHHRQNVITIKFEDDSFLSLVYSTYELQKRYNSHIKGLIFEYSKDFKTSNKVSTNTKIFWKNSWKFCFEFLCQKKYISSSDPSLSRDEIIEENKHRINNLFDSMLINHVCTKGQNFLPILE